MTAKSGTKEWMSRANLRRYSHWSYILISKRTAVKTPKVWFGSVLSLFNVHSWLVIDLRLALTYLKVAALMPLPASEDPSNLYSSAFLSAIQVHDPI